MAPQYTDFRLTLELDQAQSLVITAHGPGDTYAGAQVPYDLRSIQRVLEQIEVGEAPTLDQMQEVGKHLHDLLFPTEVARLFQQSYAAQSPGTHLRLKLHHLSPELTRLPWELAFDGQRFLAARLTHPIVRYIESQEQESLKLRPLELPLRLLYLQASPHSRDQLDLQASEETIQKATKGWAEIEIIRSAKSADLLKALCQGAEYHILHFDGHGGFDPHRHQGFLLFEDEDGQERILEGALLADYLAGTQIRLVVLAACNSGKSSAQQHFVGTAEKLMHNEALPAVVAMQFGIEDKSAIAFNRGFYEALVGGYPVEGAVIAGRKAILDHLGGYEQGSLAGADWASPTLFMRRAEGQLFPAAEAQAKQREHTVRVLVEGLPTDYRPRIQNFLAEYLGTSKHKVPFGGRDRELAALDVWLADEEAPPYALLAAEAGRGKSALLVQWAARLTERNDIAVVFIPISIRFNTALSSVIFTALAAQLGEVYGEPVQWTNLSAEQWRGVCESYLRRIPPEGKQVVVILDGLDEAADWQAGPDFFPAEAVSGVRAVVSARYLVGDVDEKGWRARLGWERTDQAVSMVLSTLGRQELAEVLYAMGNPLEQLAAQIDIMGELHRLSEGDPLLVRLYVELLLAESTPIMPEALGRIEPGLEGYFHKWWEDQRKLWGKASPLKERVVEGVFNLLACALGPLKRDDLLALAPTEMGLSSWSLMEALYPLERLIAGDGERQGYVFSHPRLGYYFHDKLSSHERAFWEKQFLAFGRRVLDGLNQGALPPHQISAYILQYYGAHLERAEAPAESLFELAGESWMRAWEALGDLQGGFLRDVERIWQRTEEEQLKTITLAGAERAQLMALQVRCALCYASVRALSANVSPTLLALAVEHQILTGPQTLGIVRQIPEEKEQVQALKTLVPKLPQNSMAEALQIIEAIWDGGARAQLLSALAPHLSETLLHSALQIVEVTWDRKARVQLLSALAPHLSETLLHSALQIVEVTWDRKARVQLLSALAPHLSETLLHSALRIVEVTGDEKTRADALSALAPYLRQNLLDSALQIARAIQSESVRVYVYSKLLPYLTEELRSEIIGHDPQANQGAENDLLRAEFLSILDPNSLEIPLPTSPLHLIQATTDEESYIRMLAAVVSHLPEAFLPSILQLCRTLAKDRCRAKLLQAIIPRLPESLLPSALQITRTIWYEELRIEVLIGIIPRLSGLERSKAIDNALSVCQSIWQNGRRVQALGALVPYLPEHLLPVALQMAQDIEDNGWQSQALGALVPYLPEHLLPVALQMAQDIEDNGWRAQALGALMPYLPGEQRKEILTHELQITRSLGDKEAHTHTLLALAQLGLGSQRLEMLTSALLITKDIEDVARRAKTLLTLIPLLPEELLSSALYIAQDLEDNEWRIEVLKALIPLLPENWLPAEFKADGVYQNWYAHTGFKSEDFSEKAEFYHAASSAMGGIRELETLMSDPPDVQHIKVLEVLALVRRMRHWKSRVELLSKLTPYLCDLARHDMVNAQIVWSLTIRFLAQDPRPEFLHNLAPLLPFVTALCGNNVSEAAALIFRAIQEVCSWWSGSTPRKPIPPDSDSRPVGGKVLHILGGDQRLPSLILRDRDWIMLN